LCGSWCHSSSCREVGPQPRQDYYGRLIHPETSLETQRLIVPPEPKNAREEKVGETFFVAQNSADVFIGDGDDDESPETESGPAQ
jgi:hypothetical protein